MHACAERPTNVIALRITAPCGPRKPDAGGSRAIASSFGIGRARHKAEEEARLLVDAQERAKADEESRRQIEAERHRSELERKRLADEAVLAESLRRAAEEQQLAEDQARIQAEEQERYLSELGSVKQRLEDEPSEGLSKSSI